MRAQELTESSGYTLAGSYTPDLVFSKLWLATILNKIFDQQEIDTVPVAYVLGSWYGNLAIILRKLQVPIQHIVNVETNKEFLQTGQEITQLMKIKNVKHMLRDANKLEYKQLKDPGIVINTSTNDMLDQGWFSNIPPGTLVVLQGRDHVNNGAIVSPDQLLDQFPLESVLYSGSMNLEDPETAYRRSMIIGVKNNQQLDELSFLGSPCTKDCSGHRAGYAWSQRHGGIDAASWSQSFNNGAALAKAGK